MNDSVNDNYYNWYNKSEKLRMYYPSEIVIGFIKNNFNLPSNILDLGTASGRHALCFAELGHNSYGLDLSDQGFTVCQEIANNKKLSVNLQKGYMQNTPYTDNFFHGIVCISSIGGNYLSTQKIIVDEVYRILKKNGIFLVNFYGLKDGVYGKFKNIGIEVERKTLSIPGNLFHHSISAEIPKYTRHFSTKKEIKNMFKKYSELKIFDMYLPHGNANMSDNVMPVHHIYAMARK